MRRELLHLWGPFSINSYGLAILVGVLVCLFLMLRHPRRKQLITQDALIQLILMSILVAVAGARLLYILGGEETLTSFWDIFAFWHGGLSILGGVIGVVLFLPFYLRHLGVPILPLLDLAGLYAPIIDGFGRIGCFLAGCCFGKPSDVSWAVTYTDPNTSAPLCIPMHPTQLYSAVSFFALFFIMYFVLQKVIKHPGQLLMIYLMGTSIIRFSIDFFRGDQQFFQTIPVFTFIPATLFSLYQWVALGLFCCALVGFLILNRTPSQAQLP